MKKYAWTGIFISGAIFALLTNTLAHPKILPTGKLIETKPLDSDILVTPEVIQGKPKVEIVTSKGVVIIELRPELAPKSVVNYLNKWNSGYCSGKIFHRVEDWVVQGCDPKGDGSGGTLSLPTEISIDSFTTGAVGIARQSSSKDLSNDSQFFIVKKDSKFLDEEYTYLGKVVSGMDVVNMLVKGDKITSTSILSK